MTKSREKKLVYNTFVPFVLQITTVLCGLILPRLIIKTYGSKVNGLVGSVSDFLGIITLLDLGVGSVVQSTLYKPLAENDNDSISRIYVSAKKFFRRIAAIFLAYVIVLLFLYPLIKTNFDFFFTDTLIGAICISSFAQYYFGIVNTLLLKAHQKAYVQGIISIITLVLNTIACVVLIKLGFAIQTVRLTTSLIFLMRPLYLEWYVRKNYNINRKITYTEEPIKQKWNGMAQHAASYVLSGTDTIVLTLFSGYANISIYNTYNFVITGVKNVLLSMSGGFQSLMGEMLAKKEFKKLESFFSYVEWSLHTGTTLIFGCTGVLIIPFIRVYTRGVTDAEYINTLFAVLITAANAGHCLRLPYNTLILAAGHYKQTQKNYIVAMIMNIVISVGTVAVWGLVGVAIGTLSAMFYQTIWMAWYNSKNIICWDFKKFLKQCGVDLITVLIAVALTFKIPLLYISYGGFAIQAAEVFVCWLVVVIIVNLIFYRQNTLVIAGKIKSKLKK